MSASTLTQMIATNTSLLFILVAMSICPNSAHATNSVANIQALSDADYRIPTEKSAKLGQLLFYDKILSGNRNISCASCHHPDHATSDGLSLGIGEGGVGLGPDRRLEGDKIKHRITRNSPALFNLGAYEYVTLFHDGRLTRDSAEPGGFNSPAEEFLPSGLNSIVSAQALFPMASAIEMAGDLHENEVAGAVRRRIDYAWTILTKRIQNIPAYTVKFKEVYKNVSAPSDINITHIANSIGDFVAFEWRADNSDFDHYLAGENEALSDDQLAGMKLFYGKAQCSTCHIGVLQTDHQFHSLALPQLGPGRTRRFDLKARDMGRINESDALEDAYRFRTPSLRNVQHTSPYGHNGTYNTLEAIITHHANPLVGLASWDREQVLLPELTEVGEDDFLILADNQEQERLSRSYDIKPVELSKAEISLLISFMSALTDEQSLYGRLGIPESVPSLLSIEP